jgi:hypothetical protein
MTVVPSQNAETVEMSHRVLDIENKQRQQDRVDHDKLTPPRSIRGDVDKHPDWTKQNEQFNLDESTPQSAFKNLGLLDRFLAVWIFLAMALGIILGNFVPSTERDLDKGSLVGVSIPIGM